MADLGPHSDERDMDARTRVLLDHAQTGTELDRDVLDTVAAGLPDDEFRAWLLEAVSAARSAAEAEDSSNSVGALAAHAEWVSDFGLPDLSLLLLGEAHNLASSLSTPDEQDLSNVSNVTGLVAFKLGYLDIADTHFSDALDLARRSHAGDLESAALLNQCNVKWATGDPSGAKQLALESLEAALAAGDRHGAVKCQLTLAHHALDAKNVDEARRYLNALERSIPPLRQPDLTSSLHSLRGDVHVQEGNLAEAEAEYHLTLRAARRAHDAGKQVAALQNLAAVATDQGKRPLGLRRLKGAVALAEAHPMLVRQLGTLYDLLARAEHEAGNPPEVLRRARQSLTLAERSGVRETTAMSLVGAALLENGELEEGTAILEGVLPTLVEELPHRPDARDDLVPVLHNLILAAGRSGGIAEQAPTLRETIDRLPDEDRAEALDRLLLAWVDVDQEKTQTDAEPLRPPAAVLEDLAREALSLRPASGRAWAGLILGNRLRRMGRPEVATPVLRLALRVAERRDQIEIAASLRNDLALSYADQGKWQPATRLLETNHALAEDRRDRRSAAQSLHNLSEIHRRQGHGPEALAASRRALDLAQQLDDSELAAESWLQLGLTLSSPMEDFQAARQAFTESLATDRSDHVRGDNLAGLAGLAIVDEDFEGARSTLLRGPRCSGARAGRAPRCRSSSGCARPWPACVTGGPSMCAFSSWLTPCRTITSAPGMRSG